MAFRDRLQYSSCSEDLQSEIEVLKMLPNADVVSVAGGGGRILGLIGHGNRQITAIDFNQTQIDILIWKMAAFRLLDYSEFCKLMGLDGDFFSRKRILARIQSGMPKLSVRVRWRLLRYGLLFAGRVEEHFVFGASLINFFYPRLMQKLLLTTTSEDRTRVWDELNAKPLWGWMARQGSSPWVYRFFLQNIGWYNQLPDGFNVSQFVLGRIRKHLERDSVLRSHLLQLVLYGRYFPEMSAELPHYLRPENFTLIKSGLSSVSSRCADVTSFFANYRPNQPVVICISNVPAYLSNDQHLQFWQKMAHAIPKGSLVVGRHFLRNIQLPAEVAASFEVLEHEAQKLSNADTSFIYDLFVLRKSM